MKTRLAAVFVLGLSAPVCAQSVSHVEQVGDTNTAE